MKRIYFYITKIYNFVFSILEDLFLKKGNQIKNYNLKNNGYIELKLDCLDINKYLNQAEEINANKYMKKYVLNKGEIFNLVKNIFVENKLTEEISKLTNFNYCIDFMLAYATYPIAKYEFDKEWYANHWHQDKPYTKNMLKLIIPLQEISSEDYGGIEIINKKDSLIFMKDKKFPKEKIYKMICDTNSVLLFKPNLCFHRAGLLKKDKPPRKQIMLQLNPSRFWSINDPIEDKQKHIEPKFPYFSYFQNKRIKLSNL